MDAGIRLVIEQVTKGMPHRARREQVGGDLVQEGLERVIVMPVDDHHVDLVLAQLACCADPGEPAAKHQNPRAAIPGPGAGQLCQRSSKASGAVAQTARRFSHTVSLRTDRTWTIPPDR